MTKTPTPPENTLIMGRFASVYAVKGWLKVNAFTTPIDNLLQHKTWLVHHNRQWQPVNIEDGRAHGKFLIVKLEGLDDRELARHYTNDFIAIEREALNPTETDEFYWEDLIGLRVIDQAGRTLGQITALMETGSNDVIVIRDKKNKEILVPYLDSVVKSVDLQQKRMEIEWDWEA